MAPPVQEDKERGLQCGEMYNCVLPKESRHHPSLDFLEMVGRKPQAGKRVRRGKEKGVYVERCIFGSSGSWLRANLLQIAPSPNAYPQKGPKFGFFCITYSHLGECARKYYNILSRAAFTWILCEHLYSQKQSKTQTRHKHKLRGHLGQIQAYKEALAQIYVFAKRYIF